MDKAASMCHLQHRTYLIGNLKGFSCLQLATLSNELLQGWTMNIFHHQKILVHFLNKVINRNSIGVSKRGGSASFTTESLDRSRIVLIQGTQHLDSYNALDPVVPCFKDACHATRGDMLTYFVPSGNQAAFELVQYSTSSNLANTPQQEDTVSDASITLLLRSV